mgnify:CR=1 FL=1
MVNLPMLFFALWLLCICPGLWVGCAQEEAAGDDPVVARVADVTITAQDVRAFIDRLPAPTATEQVAGREREHLQTLVDTELLLLEARAQRIGESPAFLSRLNRMVRDKLVQEFKRKAIRVTIPETELAQYLEEQGFNRALRISDIMVTDLETAERVLQEVDAGVKFAEVARKWSTNRETAAMGGDIGRFVTRYEMRPAIAALLFRLPVGSVSAPIPVGGRYSIFKILEEMAMEPAGEMKKEAAEALRRRKFASATDSLVAALTQDLHLRRDEAGLLAFVELLQRGANAAAGGGSFDIVLYRYDDGQLDAAAVIDVSKALDGVALASLKSAEQLDAFIRQHVIPDVLLQAAALRDGISDEEEISTWLKERKRHLLLSGLRGRMLQRHGPITAEEIRQYYDAHQKKFLHPEQFDIQEILVDTLASAERLRDMIEDGSADMGDLARAHSIRSLDVRNEKGRFHLHLHESAQFGGLAEAVMAADVGELVGPVEVREGFSVFRVLSKERKRESFEEAKWAVTSQLRRGKQRQAFNELLREVQDRYGSEVEIYGDRFTSAFAAR